MKYHLTGIQAAIGLLSVVIINATGASAQHHDGWEDSLILIIQNSRAMQLPLEPLENKIKEGRAKKCSTAQIYSAVKNRQQLLLQIRGTQMDTFSQGYAKQLFDLERSNSPDLKTNEHRVDAAAAKKSPQQKVPAKVAVIKERAPIDTLSGEKINRSHAGTAQGNGPVQKADRKMVKATQKAEKTMEKAASRAEKKMENIQKKLQKRAMKSRGNGN